MPRARSNPLFELGGQWIAAEPGSPFFHRFWTEPGSGRTRRASLRTEDLEEAKQRLAEIVVKGAPKTINTPLSAVLLNYFEERTDKLASKKHARLAGRTLLACWGDTVRVEAGKTEAKQREFVEWSLKQGHSLGYISRNLSVLSAAFAHNKIDATVIVKPATMVEKWALDAKPPAKRFTPSDDELAKVLAEPLAETFWRWTVISLLTGARPEAVVDLTPAQRLRDTGLLALNPEDRLQNKKYRATVREPRALTAWLDKWEADMEADLRKREPDREPDIRNLTYCGYASVESVQTAFERVRVRKTVNLPRLSAYSYRHKIATVMRKARLPKEEREMQLGHARPEGYGEWDPDFLQGVADALDAWWIGLQKKVDAEIRQRRTKTKERVRKVRLFPVSAGASNAKLASADVIDIRQRIAEGEGNSEIARHYPVTHHAVNKIRRGKSWGNRALDEPFDSLREGLDTPDKFPGGSK